MPALFSAPGVGEPRANERRTRGGEWEKFWPTQCAPTTVSLSDQQTHTKMERTPIKKEQDKRKTEEEAVRLRREIGLLPAVSFIIGTVVGSGIFIAPKGVLMNSGSVGLSLLVWALCGILSLFGKTMLFYIYNNIPIRKLLHES